MGGLFPLLSAQQSLQQLQDPPLCKWSTFRRGNHPTEPEEFYLHVRSAFETHVPASAGLSHHKSGCGSQPPNLLLPWGSGPLAMRGGSQGSHTGAGAEVAASNARSCELPK